MFDSGKVAASILRQLGEMPDMRYGMGHAARQTFEDKFRTELSAGRIIDVMEQVSKWQLALNPKETITIPAIQSY